MKIIIKGVPGWDGSYDLDLDAQPFTNGELHLIKQISGVRAGELREALDAGDNDVFVSFAMVSLERSGRPAPIKAFWDAPAASIDFEMNGAGADAGPPDQETSEK